QQWRQTVAHAERPNRTTDDHLARSDVGMFRNGASAMAAAPRRSAPATGFSDKTTGRSAPPSLAWQPTCAGAALTMLPMRRDTLRRASGTGARRRRAPPVVDWTVPRRNGRVGAQRFMSQLQVGLVGLPNVGKTTLFNAMTRSEAAVATYAFSTRERNMGTVPVPDTRLDRLAEMFQPKKVTPTDVEFVDVA